MIVSCGLCSCLVSGLGVVECVLDVVVWLLSVSIMSIRFFFLFWVTMCWRYCRWCWVGFLHLRYLYLCFFGAAKLIDGIGRLKVLVGLCLEGLFVVGVYGTFESDFLDFPDLPVVGYRVRCC